MKLIFNPRSGRSFNRPERQSELVGVLGRFGIAFYRRCRNCGREFGLTAWSKDQRKPHAGLQFCPPKCNQAFQHKSRVNLGVFKTTGRKRRERLERVLNHETIAKIERLVGIAKIEKSFSSVSSGPQYFGAKWNDLAPVIRRSFYGDDITAGVRELTKLMAETLHPDPWRTRGDYDEDRRRMKYMMVASVIASIGAVISSVAALSPWFTRSLKINGPLNFRLGPFE